MALGPVLAAVAALRLLTLERLLARIGGRLGLDISAIVMTDPLAAVDVDKPDDHLLVEAILAGRE